MVKYIVKVNIDKERYFQKVNPNQRGGLKSWNGESPLYVAGKCYSLRKTFCKITPKFEMATMYNKEIDAICYAEDFFGCYCPLKYDLIKSVEVIKVMFNPHFVKVCKKVQQEDTE